MSRNSKRDSDNSNVYQLLHAIEHNDMLSVQEILSLLNSDQINTSCGPLQINALQVACILPGDQAMLMVNLLISHGADPTIQDKLGRTPLHFAATNGNLAVVALLLEKGANINAIYEISSIRKHDSQKSVVDHNFKLEICLPVPECLGRTPLHQAVKSNNKEVVKLLLLKGAFVNALDEHGVTPLLLAGAGVQKDKFYNYEDYEEIVSLLIEHEADVNVANNYTGTTALHHAVAIESVKATKALLDANAHIKEASCGQTPLHEAAERGNVQILQLLLNFEDRQINRPDNVGRTVLHKAAFAGSRSCVKLLVEYGGDLSAETKSKITVIEAIFTYVPRPTDLMKKLLNSKITCNSANINSVDFRLNLDFRVLAPKGSNRQMSVLTSLMDITSGSQMNEIMQHPLIESYLSLKWQRLRIFFTILVMIYIVFVISLSIYVVLVVHDVEWASFLIALTRHILLFSAFALFVHACIQCVLVPRHYFKQYEMALNLVCALMAFVIGIFAKSSLKDMKDTKADESTSWILHVMSITVLLAWTELMLLIGRFPAYGYYALMFSTVLQNVVKVLLTFVCLVIGFALSFSVQFHNTEQFKDPWRALVKTTVMMMGEYEYGDLFTVAINSTNNGEITQRLPGTSRIIFLMFIIIASIVLMNLMVGLAVNDIHALKTSGHVQRLVKQAMFLSHLETVLSHKILRSDLFPGELYRVMYSRRCIQTEVTLKPGYTADSINIKWINLIAPCLMDSLVQTAVNTRKKTEPQDETDAPMVSMLRDLQEQILEMRNMLEEMNNRLEKRTH